MMWIRVNGKNLMPMMTCEQGLSLILKAVVTAMAMGLTMKEMVEAAAKNLVTIRILIIKQRLQKINKNKH
jgi:hypothetical protein